MTQAGYNPANDERAPTEGEVRMRELVAEASERAKRGAG